MNAPTTSATIAPAGRILVTHLVPSRTHIQELRRSRFDKKALAELAESIKGLDVLQPIVARPIEGGRFEIVAGERRFLAAKMAGAPHIPATIKSLTDEQVLEIQLVENLQREGLHELEEAEGYEELMKLKKVNADQVAVMVGKSRSYVYGRTKLLALCPEARKAFYADELDASKALLIARIGHHDTQRQALADITQGEVCNGRREGEAMSYRDAHKHILERYMLKLTTAPFDIKDAALVAKAGDCIKCPKRTGNQADLFGDVKSADICTDPKCFDDKRQAHFAGARKALEAKGRKVIHGAEAKKLLPHWEHNDNGYLSGTQYVLVTDSEYVGGRYQKIADVLGKDYEPTLIQHPSTGKLIEVAPRSTVAAKASAKTRTKQKKNTASGGGTGHGPTQNDIERMVAERALKILAEKYKGPLTHAELVHVASSARDSWSESDFTFRLFKLNYGTKLDKLSDKDLARIFVLGEVENELLEGYGSQAFADAMCKRFKIDLKKLDQEVRAELKKKAEEDKAKAAKAKAAPAKKPAAKKGKKK